jgi:hypothetical protein
MEQKHNIIRLFSLTTIGILLACPVFSQDLLNLFNDSNKTVQYTEATFKTARIILGQSVEGPAKHDLLLTVGHHFGSLNLGHAESFGLDVSTIRLGITYGLTNRLCIGLGKSTYQKNLDGFIKYKLLRQSSGKKIMPVTVCYFGAVNFIAMKWQDTLTDDLLYPKISYVNQLLIARKFNSSISIQLTASHVHYNLVKRLIDQNDVFAMGAGGRFKISDRTSINFEYHFLLPGQTAKDFTNSLSIGFDIETGGHVFQVFLTNSHPLFERGFIAETTGRWDKGDIFLGFNINRIFTL